MADRPTRRLTNIGLQMPAAVNVDQGQARAWARTSDNLYRMSMQVHDRLDNEARIDGVRQGMSGDLTDGLMFQPTIRGEAFTQQAIKSYWSNLESSARVQIDQLAAKHRNDPQGLSEAVETYISSVSGGELPKEFVQQTRNYLTTTSMPYIARARKGLIDTKIAQAEANAIVSERTAIMQIDAMASGIFSSDPGVAQTSTAAVSQLRARLESIYSSTIEDDLGNKVPVFSPQSQAKASIAMDERVAKSTLTGWFHGQRNKIAALQAIRTGSVKAPIVVDGKVVGSYNPMGELPMEARKALLSSLRSEYASEVSLRNSLQAASDRARKRAEERRLVDLMRRGARDPNANILGEANHLLEDTESPAMARQLIGMMVSRSPTGRKEDTMAYNLARIDALEGRFDKNTANWQLLGAEGIADLTSLNIQAQERLEGDRTFNDGDYLDMKDFIASQAGWIDAEAARADTSRRTEPQKRAIRLIAQMAEAKFQEENAGKKFDARAWVSANAAEEMSGRAELIEKARASAQAARASMMQIYTEKLRTGLNSKQIESDPTYQAAVKASRDLTRQLKALVNE